MQYNSASGEEQEDSKTEHIVNFIVILYNIDLCNFLSQTMID